ncbi:hypothetical protein BD311DRAFT_514237 [Dichomitus squalens]|uniref:Uncharacterized protein n=1 Tax=Dichomitus squalens TaxID=114155 RepID=A0A4Q9MYP4_9APHY|nr:hypothetical protein BD311DRAFT_514237 [Dichomitus squalens]
MTAASRLYSFAPLTLLSRAQTKRTWLVASRSGVQKVQDARTLHMYVRTYYTRCAAGGPRSLLRLLACEIPARFHPVKCLPRPKQVDE